MTDAQRAQGMYDALGRIDTAAEQNDQDLTQAIHLLNAGAPAKDILTRLESAKTRNSAIEATAETARTNYGPQ